MPTGAPDTVEIESLFFRQLHGGKSRYWSAGLHPWQLDGIDFAAAEQWLREQAAQEGMLAVGETGLDKITPTPWDRQITAFKLCLRVAVDFGKPVVIHCVKAYSEVLQQLNQLSITGVRLPPVIFHGFDKHPQTARMLLDAGCFLSFGAALFRENSHAASALQQTPPARFFLETDDKDLDIKAVYACAAEIRDIPEAEILKQLWQNFQNIFFNKG